MMKSLSITRNKAVIFLIASTAIVYFHSLFNSYALDDELYALSPLLENPQWKQFFHHFTIHTFVDKDESGYAYRPLSLNSFLVEYLVFGKHVFLSHLINLLLYLLVLYSFFRLLLKFGFDLPLSLGIILLFALHPVHTEVVCNLKCRDELLAFTFMSVSFHLAVNYINTPKMLYLLGAPLLFLLALLAKESVVPFFVFIPLSLGFIKADPKKMLYLFVALSLSVLIYFLIRKFGLPAQHRKLVLYENPVAVLGIDAAGRLTVPLYLSWRYLSLLICPYPLAYYYGYAYVDVFAPLSLYSILGALAHIALIVLFFKTLRQNKPLAFGISLYLLTLSPLLFFVRLVPGLMGERFLFAASFGYCIMLGIGLHEAYHYFKKRYGLSVNPLYALVLICYTCLSFQRSKVWKNKETLFEHDMPVLKESAKANLLYGALLSEQALKAKDAAKLEKAIGHLEKTVRIVPSYSLAWENLGVLYYFKGDTASAFSRLDSAIRKDKTNPKAYFDKGIIYQKTAQRKLSEKNFRLSLAYDPYYVPAYLKLMKLYSDYGEYEKSYRVGEAGAAFEKKSDNIYSDLVRIALLNGDTLKAVCFSEKAVAVNATNRIRIQTLEGYFRSKGNYEKANYYRSLIH